MSVNRSLVRGRLLPSLWALFCRALHVRNSIPCVGLVVLGGCLTAIIVPEDGAGEKPLSAERTSVLPTIVIDPGHGGKDEGTQWRGLAEKDVTLDLALRLERLLQIAGFPTVLTRRSNVFVPLPERARIANQLDNALFISLHLNSDQNAESTGIETYFAKQKVPIDPEWAWVGFFNHPSAVESDTSEVLAGAVHASVITRTDARNRGLRARDYYVIRHTSCPAVLIEGGFLSNVFEAELLKTDAYKERLAIGIAEGVISYQKQRAKPLRVQPRLARADF